MNLPSITHFITADGFRMQLGHYVKTANGVKYQVIDDNDLGYSICEVKTKVVEKLTDDLASKLYAIGYAETQEIIEGEA